MSKTMLITGICGFIGSNCSKYFSQNNFDVYGIDLIGTPSSKIMIDTISVENIRKFNVKFDIILHLAGTGTVRTSQENPEIESIKTIKSSEYILDYIEKYNRDTKLIYISSAAVYGNNYNTYIKEDALRSPISVYGQHKVLVENLIKNHNNIDYKIIRLFSVYGNGLKKQVIWDFCNKIKNNINRDEIVCYGTGNEERDFIHVDDVLQLIEQAINTNKQGLIINGGNGKAIKICYIFDVLSKLCNYNGKLKYNNDISEYNPQTLIADVTKAKEIGYNQKITIEQGLKNYVEWFKKI